MSSPTETDAGTVSLLDRPMYSYADVDRHLGLHSGTARRWLNGYRGAGTQYDPVLRAGPVSDDVVTWGEFVETRLLSEYRDRGVSLQRLRPAVERLRHEFGRYPLAHAKPFLDVEGRELVRKIQDEVGLPRQLQFVVVRSGQGLISARPVAEFMKAVDYDGGTAVRIRPGRVGSPVVIDPERQGGRPVVRSVPTEILLEQFRAGESFAEIAELWELSTEEIEAALRYELPASTA